MQAEICSVTLAAGTGSRMPPDMPPKPCCKIGPLSVMENALETYEAAGIYRHVVVVGHAAAAVMAAATRGRRDVLFAFQGVARGTGDAVRRGLELLDSLGGAEHVLITAGDKVITPQVARGLLDAYAESGMDFLLAAGPCEHNPGGGRVIVRDGRVQAIIEMPDIRVRELAAHLRGPALQDRPGTVGRLAELAVRFVPRGNKLATYIPALSALMGGDPGQEVAWADVLGAAETVPDGFDRPTGRVTLEQAVSADLSNLSVYVGRFDAVRDAVAMLGTDNVQGESYFTDVVEILAASGQKVGVYRVARAEDVMAFNTIEELDRVRRVHAVRAQSRARYPRLGRWAAYFDAHDPASPGARAVRQLSAGVGPERPAIVVRSPGRVNLMGRHVDHQGGTCNLVTIDREIVIAASPRHDDRINLWNADAQAYPFRSFSFAELTADIVWENWLHTLDSQYIRRVVSLSAGDWANYVKGAALRLQHRFGDRRLRGMDAFFDGDIPVAAGLSSSSALVVGTAEALAELNGLNIRPKEFVYLCGEGEWFVVTRGGSADHAAIKFGRQGQVVSVSFFPFEVTGRHPFPEECSLIICHSGISARKTENARERFNACVACYHMAREIIREKFPEFAPRIAHLRDINTRRLDVSLPALYRLLREVPARVGPSEAAQLATRHATVAQCLEGLNMDEHEFPLRDVTLYGLAECERAARTGELLHSGEVAELGRMMNISHDGDRVSTWRPDRAPYDSRASDELMEDLVGRASSLRSVSEAGAALWQLPGAYDCSTPEIDLMVDRVLCCPGVLGAQLAGAGLGGCIMVLARKGAEDEVRGVLERDYYGPRDVEPRLFVCHPSRGSQVLTSVDGAEA